MILEVDNVELYFNEKRILNGVYLKAEIGKVTALLGSNGSGKSCIMQIVFGTLKAKYKLVRVNGKPVLKPLYKTNLVSYLPQHTFIPSGLKLKTLFQLMTLDWNSFIDIFEGFYGFEHIKIQQLSGGERRVIETYLILKSNREIILLDEPFSHLAPIYVEQFKTLILQEKKHKVILITDHLYEHITELSDTIYLIKNGCSTQIESIDQLKDYNYLSL
jgi:ABC-type multidrug transport system ATPase subunit